MADTNGMNGLLTDVALFISKIDVSSIHTSSAQLAKVIAASVTPTLLLIAIYVRIVRGSLDTFSGGGSGKWSRAVKDFLLWGAVCASYFIIGELVINFANGIYAWCDSIGGLQLLTNDMSEVTKAVALQNSKSALGSLLTTGPLTLITTFFYYLSLLLVAFIEAALKIAHAICFGFAFIWGLIAIPISVSEGIKLIRGWALLLGFAILWPFVQAILIAIIRPSFIGVLNEIISRQSASVVQNTDIIMTIFNVVFAAAMIAAPFIANALVNNAAAGAAVVSPFLGAALAGVGAVFEGTKMAGGGVQSGVNTVFQKAKGAFGSADVAPSPIAQASVPVATTGGPSQPQQSPAAQDNTTKQKQQRRGVIIRQQGGGK